MDNVDLRLGTELSDPVQQIQQPRRIKISERSQKGLFTKIRNSISTTVNDFVSTPSTQESTPSVVSNEVTSTPVQTTPQEIPVTPSVATVEKNARGSVLDNVTLRGLSDFVSHTVNSLRARMIRLTDDMYIKVGVNTAPANVEPTVELGDISTPEEVTTVNQKEEAVSEVQPSTEDVDTAKVDVTEMQEAVNDAFTSVPEVAPAVDNSMGEMDAPTKKVKKASYTKANVEKYNVPEKTVIELPRFTGNDIFNQSQSKVTEQEPRVEEEKPKEVAVEPVSNRDVPIVVAERPDSITTKVNEKSDTVTDTDTKFLFEIPAEDVATMKNETSASGPAVFDDEVEDIGLLRNEIVKLQRDNAEAQKRVKSAQEEYETSVVEFKKSSEKRKEEANNLRLQAESLKASTKAFDQEANDLKARTAQNNAARQKIEADILELNELRASVSEHKQYRKQKVA